MRTSTRSLCWPFLVLVLCSCAGTPTTYLTLSPVPPDKILAAQNDTPVEVARVSLPPSVDRLSLTTMTSASTLDVAGHTRWIAPLDELTQIVLAQNLAARLSGATVLMPGDAPTPSGARQVHVNIQNFMPDQAGTVTLDTDWEIDGAVDQAIIERGRFHLTVSGSATPAGEANSMNGALGKLADVIAPKL